jgi:hypothetical protein
MIWVGSFKSLQPALGKPLFSGELFSIPRILGDNGFGEAYAALIVIGGTPGLSIPCRSGAG